MSFAERRDNQKLIKRISTSILSGSLSHAYIIEADRRTDKLEFAMDFLKATSCELRPGIGCEECASCRRLMHGNCEDLHIVSATGNSLKDKDISELQDKLRSKPLGRRNMAIIADADTMTVRAQNRLLKTLEEPSGNALIVLLSENRENLLQTIRSRCVAYSLNSYEEQASGQKAGAEAETGKQAAEEVVDALLANEKFFFLKQILSKRIKNSSDAKLMLDEMEVIYRNCLLGKDARGRSLKQDLIFYFVDLIEEARRDIIANVNYSYALKELILKIGGIYG